MGTTSSAIFTGSSQFSQDFQNTITRAVNIASLPLNQLNNNLKSLQSQSTDLNTLDTKFTALQTAIQGVEDGVGGAAYQPTISNPAVVSASVSDGAQEGNYSIEVVDAGAYSKSLTTSSWVNLKNPPGQTHTYQLWIGDQGNPKNEVDITPADNSAQSVAQTINAAASGKVTALAVNVGTADTPDWRISLQSTALDNISLEIKDGATSLQTQTAGHKAQYAVDGAAPVYSTSGSVQVSPGVTINLLSSAPGKPVDVTITRSTSALNTALSSLASAYNDAVDALDQQRGQSTGSLNGDSIIYTLSRALTGITTYTAKSGDFSGLADLGLRLGADGHLTFNSLQLMAADFQDSTGVTGFFGSATGGGFLKNATDLLNSLEDITTGSLKNAETSVQNQIKTTNTQISNQQDQVNHLQDRLTQQMSAADAAIASMEQQYSYLSNMFQAMQVADQQYK